jgi:hypothetical protein
MAIIGKRIHLAKREYTGKSVYHLIGKEGMAFEADDG